MSAKQLVPLSGVAAVALIVAAFAVGGETPDADASLNEVVSYYHDHDTDLQISGGLLGLGAFFFLVFSTTVAGLLRRAQGESGGSSALAFGGGVVFTVGLTIFAGLGFTAADAVDDVDPVVVQTLNALGSDMFFTVAVGTAAFALGAGIAALKTGALPKWLAWAAIVIGVIAITPIGFAGFLLLGVWTLVASVTLAMKADTA
ncbi:MAG: hypothetical protein ACXWEL_07160 [Solirubrobacterales bacterium]